jgi:hypothetical protein
MCFWKRWRFVRTRVQNLLALGVPRRQAFRHAKSRQGPWHMAKTIAKSIGRVTGNLANSVMMRVEVRGPGRVFARVGFHHAGGRHAHLVEYGTLPRATKTKGIFSSAASRGKWVGMGTYPQNFISGKEFVRGMPALRPLQKAMEKARAQMTAVLEGRMRVAALAAIRAGAARELQGSAA